MTYSNAAVANFASGELSPKVRGRYDLPLYANGCERLENFIAETQGPARYRPGSIYVNHTRLNKIANLIPFQFNADQAYLLEFTDLKMRVLKDGGHVLESAKTITDITAANPGVVTSNGHGYSDGDEVYISGVVGTTELNGKFFLIDNSDANTFTLQDIDGSDIDTTDFTAYVSDGTAEQVYELTTPYTEAQLFELKYAQNADTMYIAHPSHEPGKLTRSDHDSWAIDNNYARTNDQWAGADDYPGAVAFYEGRLGFAGTNNAPESLWISRSPDANGAPRYDDYTVGTDADHALLFTLAPNNGKVDAIRWMSGVTRFLGLGTFGGVSRFDGGDATTAITPTNLNVRPVDSFGCANIVPVSLGDAIIYVQRGTLILRSMEYDFAIDANVSVDRNLVSDHFFTKNNGIKQIVFQSGRPDLLWAVRVDGKLIGLTLKSREDVSGWHRHTIGGNGTVLSIGVIPQEAKNDQVWMVVERTINSLTRRYIEYFDDPLDILELLDFYTGVEATDKSVHRNLSYENQKIPVHLDSSLSFNGADRGEDAGATVTPAAVTGDSVIFTASASVFTAADVGNEIRKKFVDGTEAGRAKILTYTDTTHVVCQVTVEFDSTDAVAAGEWYLTAGAISGLDHLEGEEVSIVTDGAVHPNETVTDGAITLDYQASRVHIGYGYTGILKTMNLEIGGRNGPAQSKIRNVSEVAIKFFGTLGGKVGTDIYDLETILFRSTGDLMDRPAPLRTGIKYLRYQDDYKREKYVIIVQSSPLPCTVQQIDVYMETSNE